MRDAERSRLPLVLTLGVAAALFLTLFSSVPSSPPSPDAFEYRAFADAVLSGELLARRPLQDVPRALVTRTPGYPLLLAAADLVVPGGQEAKRVLHLAIGLGGLLYVVLALRRECPAWITAPIVLALQWSMRRYFAAPLTEWSCFVGLLCLFATVVRALDAPSYRRLALVGLLTAALVLTRPALIVATWAPLASAVLQTKLSQLRAAVAALVPFALVVAWMGFNLYRIGTFTITPFAGMNAVGVAMLVGHAEVEPGDGRDMRALVRGINEIKQPPPGISLDLAKMDVPGLARLYNHDVHVVAEAVVQRHGWDRVTYDRMLLAYAGRAIRGHRAAYRAYVLFGIERLGVIVPWLLVALVLPVAWLVAGRHRGLALGVLLMLAIHVLHVILCAAVEVVIDRYFELTWVPLQMASLVALAVALRDLLLRARSGFHAPQLPAGAGGAGARAAGG